MIRSAALTRVFELGEARARARAENVTLVTLGAE
jgi:hypothetical protein